MGLLNSLRKPGKGEQQDPAIAMMYGQGTPSPTQQPAAATAPAMPAADPATTSIVQQPPSMPTLAMPKAPEALKLTPQPTFDEFLKTPEGQAIQQANPEYKMPGFWQRLGMGLAFGAQEFGASMRGNPGVGAHNLMQWENTLRSQDQTNRARPGMLQASYQKSLEPLRESQQREIVKHQAGLQDFDAQNKLYTETVNRQAQANSVLSEYAKLKGKMRDADIIASVLRDSAQYGGLNPDYVKRVISAAPIIGPKFQLTKGEGGRPTGVQDTYGTAYVPDAKGQLVAPDGTVLSDPEAVNVFTAGMQGHQQERTEKMQDMEKMAEAGERRMLALSNNRVVQVVDPNNPQNVVYSRAGNAMNEGAAAPASVGFQTAKATSRDAAIGDIGKSLRAFDTAEQHLKSLEAAGNALNNGDIQALNKIANKWGLATGDSAPATYNAIQQVIAGEVNKAIAGAGTVAEGEMNVVRSLTSSDLSPQQRAGVVAGIRELMKGKKTALQQQVDRGMSGATNLSGEQSERPRQTVNGVPYEFDGKQWVKVKPKG